LGGYPLRGCGCRKALLWRAKAEEWQSGAILGVRFGLVSAASRGVEPMIAHFLSIVMLVAGVILRLPRVSKLPR
jgi:hypothetical protein